MQFSIKTSASYTQEIIDFLSDTTWGLKGPKFKHQDVEQRIKSNPNNLYVCAYDQEKLVGTLVFCLRKGELDNQIIDLIYTRYFSVDPNYRGNKIGEKLLYFAEKYFEEHQQNKATLFYSYIDKKNLRSSKIAQNLNYEAVSEFRTFTYSRLNTKNSLEAEEISFTELSNLFDKKEYNTFYESEIKEAKCFAIKKQGEIKVAFRVLPTTWSIETIGGINGFLLKYIISNIPYLNKVFPKHNLSFLAMDTIYVKSSDSIKFEELSNHVLKEYGKNIAMYWFDIKDDRINALGKINHGILDNFNSKVPANIHITHKNLSLEQVKKISENSFFIMSSDLS